MHFNTLSGWQLTNMTEKEVENGSFNVIFDISTQKNSTI
jgi:hypothetical protein